MAVIDLGAGEALDYEHHAPASTGGLTFVGFNALTGDRSQWEAAIGPALRAAGHGTLFWNLRGQGASPAADGRRLDVDLAVADAGRLVAEVAPSRPVFVGLSIGGLFAARAHLAGVTATALVLINTLRVPGPRLEWITAATRCLAEVGGPALLRDTLAPVLFDGAWLQANRAGAFAGPYEPIDPDSPVYRWLCDTADADWDLPYESLALPVLVVTGLADRLFRVQADVDRLCERMPNVTWLDVRDAGHLVPLERPEVLGAALLDFGQSLAGG